MSATSELTIRGAIKNAGTLVALRDALFAADDFATVNGQERHTLYDATAFKIFSELPLENTVNVYSYDDTQFLSYGVQPGNLDGQTWYLDDRTDMESVYLDGDAAALSCAVDDAKTSSPCRLPCAPWTTTATSTASSRRMPTTSAPFLASADPIRDECGVFSRDREQMLAADDGWCIFPRLEHDANVQRVVLKDPHAL